VVDRTVGCVQKIIKEHVATDDRDKPVSDVHVLFTNDLPSFMRPIFESIAPPDSPGARQ